MIGVISAVSLLREECRNLKNVVCENPQALHPEREPLDTLERIRRTIGEYNFTDQYQQSSAPLGGGLVKREWFRSYTEKDRPKSFDRIVQRRGTARRTARGGTGSIGSRTSGCQGHASFTRGPTSAWPSNIRGGSRMRECRSSGSVGMPSNGIPTAIVFSERGMASYKVDDRERQVFNQEQALLFKVTDSVGDLNLDRVDEYSVASNGKAPIH
jgi:hypothetical protein